MPPVCLLLALVGLSVVGCAPEREEVRSADRPAADAASAGAEGANANVLLITVDTLRADRVGVYGGDPATTPTLDALAAEGVAFEAAYSPVPLTLPAHTSMMTGTYPLHHGVRDNVAYRVPEEVETLAERLRSSGYRTGALVSSFVLDSSWGLDQGFDSYHDDFETPDPSGLVGGGQAGLERTADATVESAVDWLSATDGRPFFLWVHLFDPHAPYEPPEPFRSRFAGRPYAGEIAFADDRIGALVDALRERGLHDETMVVVTGDHGEGLGEHGEVQHGLFIYEESIRVPLIVSAPGLPARGLVSEGPVSLVDVAPTILDLVEAPALPSAQGVSLSPLLTGRGELGDRPVYAESLYGRLHYGWSELRGLIGGRHKLIDSSEPEIFDLEADPEEADNLADRGNRLYLELHERLNDLQGSWSADGHRAADASVDADTRAKLEALGYVGSGPQTVDMDSSARPSPRSRIDVYNRTLTARAALKAGRLEPAEELLVGVVQEDPGVLEAQRMLGEVYSRQGRHARAAEVYRRAIPLGPEDPRSHLLLADALMASGDPAGAERVLEASAELVEPTADIQRTLGTSRAMQGELESAAEAFRATLALKEDDAHAHAGLAQVLLGSGESEAAAGHARAALDLDPDMPRARFVLAEVARAAGDLEEAIRQYEAELANQPGNVLARYRLALSYGQIGDPGAELATLEELVRIAPEFPPGNLMLARTLLRRGDRVGEAESLVERALEAPIGDQERLLAYTLMMGVALRRDDQEAVRRWSRLRIELENSLER